MLTAEQIENNKQEYLSLVRTITREGSEIDRLVAWLERSDFFTAPASTKYHASYKGGLCQHSLNVYRALKTLLEAFNVVLDVDSLIIASLFHDISKANYYESYLRNVKDEESGQWNKVEDYRVKDVTSRFIYGSHEETSNFMINSFIPLTVDEQVAILHHHGGMGYDSSKTDVGMIYTKYNLAFLLHFADMKACYMDEK